jgi:hypothetical protein
VVSSALGQFVHILETFSLIGMARCTPVEYICFPDVFFAVLQIHIYCLKTINTSIELIFSFSSISLINHRVKEGINL